jgi:diadenosine tetraphosphate (Ap4A) HIT family hydrolase
MNESCDVCNILSDNKYQLLLTNHWRVTLSNNHAYMGRAYVTLRTHKGSLGMLDREEWLEFEGIVGKLEEAYAAAFGAAPLNWACFMNNAFRQEPALPHVHWHVFPRYKQAPTVNGITFEDAQYGEHYTPKSVRLVDDETVEQIIAALQEHLTAV